MARSTGRLVLATLRAEPRELGWWLGHFGRSLSAVRSARRRLARRGLVRFTGYVRSNGWGGVGKLWETV